MWKVDSWATFGRLQNPWTTSRDGKQRQKQRTSKFFSLSQFLFDLFFPLTSPLSHTHLEQDLSPYLCFIQREESIDVRIAPVCSRFLSVDGIDVLMQLQFCCNFWIQFTIYFNCLNLIEVGENN